MNKFSLLPPELKEYIFTFLSGEDLWSCLSVSPEWRRIANLNRQWKSICMFRRIDSENYSDEEEDGAMLLCKYALLWKQNAQTVKRWQTNHFKEYIIPYKNSDDLTCRKIHTHKKKMALIPSIHDGDSSERSIQIHTFGQKSISIDKIPNTTLNPHAITINSNYVIISSGNIVITYKKKTEYKIYFGVAFCDDSRLHLATEDISNFAASKLKSGPYVRMEVLSNGYLWLSCLNSSSQLLYVINLQTLHLLPINVISRLICSTRKYVIVSSTVDIRVFTFKGDLVLKLNVQGRFKATDDFIVTSPKQGQPVTVWAMDGKKLYVIPGPVFFELDPVRHLFYECAQNGEEGCKLFATSLRTGAQVWSIELPNMRLSEIDDLYQVCDKFIIIDIFREENFHCAFVFDLERHVLLYELALSGFTISITENLWVHKAKDQLIVKIY